MKITLILSFLLFTQLLGCAYSSTRSAKDRALLHLKMGTSHLTQGNYPQALAELKRAEALDESSPLIQNNLGLAYLVRDKLTLAEVHLRKALDINSSYTEARNNLGRVLIEQGSLKDAIHVLETASRDLTYRSPERLWSNLGLAYFKDTEYKKSLISLRRSLDLKPHNCVTNTLYGRTLYELKKYKEAAIIFDKSIYFCKKLNVDEPNYYGALSYFKVGSREESITRLEELIKTFPNGIYVDRAKTMLEIIR